MRAVHVGSVFDAVSGIGSITAKGSACCGKRWNSISSRWRRIWPRRGMSEDGSPRRGSQKVWQYDTNNRKKLAPPGSRDGCSDLAQDLRHSFRGMRRDAGFTAFTILIAGLGIGASSTVFSVVNALLLRPLPFRDPGRLVWISNGDDWTTTQTEHYADLRELNRSFSDLAGWSGFYRAGDSELTGAGEPERLTSVPVTGNFFALLGVQPAIGRSFTTEECQGRYSAPPAMLLSYSFWRRRFASDPNMVGRKLTLNNRPVDGGGRAARILRFRERLCSRHADRYLCSLAADGQNQTLGKHDEDHRKTEARRDGAGAQAEFTMLGKQLDEPASGTEPDRSEAGPAGSNTSADPCSPALFVLACAVGVVMLIVCANLSNLQLAQVRHAAKGNGDAGGVRSGPFAAAAADAYGERGALVLRRGVGTGPCRGRHSRTGASPRLQPCLCSKACGSMGARSLFTLLAAVASGVLFGLLPALRVTALSLREGMQDASRGSSGGKRHAWVRDGLVVSELAFACILLVGAGLLIRSFLRVLDVNLGFQPERAAALQDRPEFSDLEFRAAELLYRRCAEPRPLCPWHCGGRHYRRPAAARRPVVGGFRRGTGLREGPPAARAIHSRRERRVFRGGGNSVAVG